MYKKFTWALADSFQELCKVLNSNYADYKVVSIVGGFGRPIVAFLQKEENKSV